MRCHLIITEDSSTQLLKDGNARKKHPYFFSIAVDKIDFDTFWKVKSWPRQGGIWVLLLSKRVFFSGIPSLNSQTIVFYLVPTLNHHDIASKASVTAVSVTASGSPSPQCQRVWRLGCTLHTLEWKDRGSFLWFWPRWGRWVERILQLLDVKISYLRAGSVQTSCCL